MRNHRKVRRGVLRITIALAAGFSLTLGISTVPAVAAEGIWLNEGGDARSPDAMNATTFNGEEYEILRGNDNRIWWRYSGYKTWREHPGGGITYHRPEVVVVHNLNGADRLAALVTGTDGQIYYSFLGGAAANVWSGWSRIPGNAGATSYVSAATGNDVAPTTLVTNRGSHIIATTMQLSGIALSFRSDWVEWEPSGVQQGVDVVQAYPYVRGVTRDIKTYIVARIGSRPIMLGYSAYDVSSLETASYQFLPGGGECADIAFGRGGDAEPLFAINNYEQTNFTVACTSPNDHQLWLNRSSNAGSSWSGWAPSTNGSAFPGAAPEVHGRPSGEVFADITWGGPEGSGVSQRMILMKRVQ